MAHENDTPNDAPQPVGELSYEEARKELEGIVRRLEQGQLSLDDSLALWERGEELGRWCEDLLDGAHKRIEDALAARTAEKDAAGATADTAVGSGTDAAGTAGAGAAGAAAGSTADAAADTADTAEADVAGGAAGGN